MDIKEIEKERAIEFVRTYHYSNVMPRLTKHFLGLFEYDELVGVITLGWGTQPKGTVNKITEGEYGINDYYEIGKMCFKPDKNNSNFGSKALKKLSTWCKINTDIKFIYTLADGIMGKVGYVYQSSSYIYIGNFETQIYMDEITKEKIHPRSSKKLISENEIMENKKIYWLSHDFCEFKNIGFYKGLMFRYVFPLDKKTRRFFNKLYDYDKYPKDENLYWKKRVKKGKFDYVKKPEFDAKVSKYNYQKW